MMTKMGSDNFWPNKAKHGDSFFVPASPSLQSCACWRRYGIAACSAAAGELGLQNFQGASPANPKKASKDRSSTSPERSLGSFESAGNSTSKFDYWVPVNVKAPRALFKHPRGIASAPHIPTSCSVLSSNPVYSLVNLGVPNSITIGSSRSLRSLGTG